MIDELVTIQPNRPTLLGSPAAQEDVASVLAVFEKMEAPDVMVDFDFSGVEDTNGSYLRASVYWALECGRASAEKAQPDAADSFSVRPYPLYPVVSNCADSVLQELNEFLNPRNLPILLRLKGKGLEVKEAAVVGSLDPFLASTMSLLADLGEGTAQKLREASHETITVNGWSNRLMDLLTLRLVSRRREGKFWIYQPVAKSIKLWV